RSGAAPRCLLACRRPASIRPFLARSRPALRELGRIRPRLRAALLRRHSDIDESREHVRRVQAERLLDEVVIGGRTGLPHGGITGRMKRQKHVLYGGAGGEDLFDRGHLRVILAEPRRDGDDEWRTEGSAPLALEIGLGHIRRPRSQTFGEKRAQAVPIVAADYEESPGT